MKKIVFILALILIPINVSAKKEEVKLDKCIDGDTISIIINKEEHKVRFLAVDSPEIDLEEAYATEAKDFTCNLLKKSKHIYLEYDSNSDKTDKYDRILAWVWADSDLVQIELVKSGYAKVAYLYNEYKYTDELKKFESYAKDKKRNIWSDYKPTVKKEKKKKSRKEIFLDRLSKSYSIIVIILAGILALITLYLNRKK